MLMHAAILQSATGELSRARRLELLEHTVTGNAFDLVVCPELFMSGYNIGDGLATLAETADGEFFQQVAALATRTSTAIVYGYPEVVDGALFNAAMCISSKGAQIANHRKLLIPPGFERSYFSPGSKYTVFDLMGIRCALLICYDAEFPETVRAVAQAGAQLVIVPTALAEQWPTVAGQLIPTRAFENGVWLMYANHAGTERGIRYLGASCIVAPDGIDAARAGGTQQIISATIDIARVTAAQSRLPYLKDVTLLQDVN